MKIYTNKSYSIFSIIVIISCFLFDFFSVIASTTTNVSINIKTYCGNKAVEVGEECDKTNYNKQTCVSQGYKSGSLKCNSDCTFDKSNCNFEGAQNGGSNTSSSTNQFNNIVLKGKAYPLSKVMILKDGQLAASTISGLDANFQVSLSNLNPGNYNLSVISEDKNGIKSKLFSFPSYITTGSSIQVTGIFLSPTINGNKKNITKGENITFFGQSAPSSEITIAVHSKKEIFKNTTTDNDGMYSYSFDTSELESGGHTAESKASINTEITEFSDTFNFIVHDKNEEVSGDTNNSSANLCTRKADFNCDNRVNIVDFSIAAFWYKKSNPPSNIDLNSDGKIDLIDFSIMAFNWTG